jgi:V-type H+-transporting ATPase subunit C
VIVYKAQAEDCIKALRKRGFTSRIFSYNKPAWEAENNERNMLKEHVQNFTTTLMRAATGSFQALFVALMHLKVVRAYVDGVLRFGIPPKFYIGIVMPKKGAEKHVLIEMSDALAEDSLKEMYGEKLDSNEADDYWPFVCVNLTSPNFMHVLKE